MSVEGISLEHFSAIYQETLSSSFRSCTHYIVLFLFLSGDSKQDSTAAAAHGKRIIDMLKNINV